MILTNEEIMQINQTAEFDNALGYARKIEQAVLESYKAELLKEAGDPVLYAEFAEDGGWLGDASEYQYLLEEPHALYTSDQLVAAVLKATKPLGEEVERLKVERLKVDRAKKQKESVTIFDANCDLRSQLAVAQEEIRRLEKIVLSAQNAAIENGVALKSTQDQLAKAEQQVAEWQPISTAPKDGTVVIVWWWNKVITAWCAGAGLSRDGGDWWRSHAMEVVSTDYPRPTHWMPLPKAPATGASS